MRTDKIGRRAVLGGLLLAAPAMAWAGAPVLSIRPRPRADDRAARPLPLQGFDRILAESGLAGMTGFALADVASGQVLEGHQADMLLPPASVTKLFTALYALDALGTEHAFETQVIATGAVQGGRVRGDLVLVGGGDPHLDTDQLAEMVKSLRDQGIRGVDGRFLVVGTALPPLHEIDTGQPDFVGYNPSISGMNLNFNRAYFEWKYVDGGLNLSMQARSDAHSPEVRSVHIAAEDRQSPLFSYRSKGGEDYWSVSASALAQPGGRWLPVRTPEIYAAEVFRALGRQYGVDLPEGAIVGSVPSGMVLARHRSMALARLARSMLLFSTNLTAEVLGLSASQAHGLRVRSLSDSGRAMTDWARARLGLRQGEFVNHSGLSDKNVVSAGEMVRALSVPGAFAALNGLMKKTDVEGSDAVIQVKTGTLNFCKGLAGYLEPPGERRLAFAIFSTDAARRAAFVGSEEERPAGSRTFSGKAKALELALLKRWAG